MFTIKENEVVIGQHYTSNHIQRPSNCRRIRFGSVGPGNGLYYFFRIIFDLKYHLDHFQPQNYLRKIKFANLSFLYDVVKLSTVSNCPHRYDGAKLSKVSNCPSVKLSSFVLMVSNCQHCQIVRSVKLSSLH